MRGLWERPSGPTWLAPPGPAPATLGAPRRLTCRDLGWEPGGAAVRSHLSPQVPGVTAAPCPAFPQLELQSRGRSPKQSFPRPGLPNV